MSAIRPLCLTWLPTRRCNIKCSYCGAFRRMPECGPEGSQRVADAILDAFPDLTFWCLLGGDVTVWGEELVPFVRHLSSLGVFYAITSNSVWITKERAKALMDVGLSNWTVSCDSLADLEGGRGRKATAARTAIDIFTNLGMKDMHCTVSISRDTIAGVPELVRWLSDHKVWAEITPFIWGKNGNYDYSPAGPVRALSPTESDRPLFEKVLGELVEMRDRGFLIHNMKEYLLAWPQFASRQQWKCKAPWNLVVDADGALKPCLHLFGKKTRAFTVWNIRDLGWDAFLEAWKSDVEEFCCGCLWNCQWEPEWIWQRTQSLDLVTRYFKHGAPSLTIESEPARLGVR